MASDSVDAAYRADNLRNGELIHQYGDRVHILSDPYHLSLLATLSADGVVQPLVNSLVSTLYRDLVARVISQELPIATVARDTRMIEHTPDGVFRGEITDPSTRVIVVDVARAGMLPAQVCFDALNHVLEPSGVRQDHLIMNRVTDDSGRVTGARLFGDKTGGDATGQVLIFPDPMGATGTSLLRAIDYYKDASGGEPSRIIIMNLIFTPEFVQNVTASCPEATLYAFRIDRGLSPAEVLATVPGTHPDQERGLNEHQYIVPGAGGLGEVINNVFV